MDEIKTDAIKPKSNRGGYRPGAGRKAKPKTPEISAKAQGRLTARQQRVVIEKLKGQTDKQALLNAGYSRSTAEGAAAAVLQHPAVQEEFQRLVDKVAVVDATRLHERWSEMFEADIADIMHVVACQCSEADRPKCTKCAGSGLVSVGYKPVHLWPKIWRQMLAGLDVKELFEHSKDGVGASWDKIGEVIKLKFVSVKEIGELLGRHKAVDAFVKEKAGDVNVLIISAEKARQIVSAKRRLDKVIQVLPE